MPRRESESPMSLLYISSMIEHFSLDQAGLDGVTVRHSHLRHPIQCGTAHQHLRGLPGEAPGGHASTKDRLEPKHGCFGQAPPMIPTLLLPGRTANLTNATQILVSGQSLGFGVAMLPDLGVVLRGDSGLRLPCPNRLVTVPPVIA